MFQPNMFEDSHHMVAMTHETSETEFGLIGEDDDFGNKSGNEALDAPSTEDLKDPNGSLKRKRYHRHTQRQIQEMEAFFKLCPHPDDRQRKELGRELGLEPLQVKFWFQNKRTQMKAQHERHENAILKADNEKLREENNRYKEAICNASCPNCGGPAALGEMSFDEQQLRIENARLREEIEKISGIASKYAGKPLASYSRPSSRISSSGSLEIRVGNFGTQSGCLGEMYGANDLFRAFTEPTEAEKPMVIELAVRGMEELMRMAKAGEPLWVRSDDCTEILNEDEYQRIFPRGIGHKPLGQKAEASRESAVVPMNHMNIVENLMDVNQWLTAFCGIVTRALTLEVLSTGVAGNYNGALQVMTAEFQVPSPLVPTREFHFLRYCKQQAEGTWAVVDVSLENLRPGQSSRDRRRPSGCLIQELPNGFSKVTWVEHSEVDHRNVHNLYRKFLDSGLAFGARRWLATLDRQCHRECLSGSIASNIPAGDLCVATNAEGRKSMLKLAERMVMSFCSGAGASTAHAWTTLSATGNDDVRVMARKSMDDPGRPPGIVLSASTSIWIPVPPKRIFDFLSNENSRTEWDILSSGGLVQEMARVANDRDPGNYVSLLRVNSENSSQSNMLILQESRSDSTGSYVVYAPVDIMAMNMVLSGGDPDYVALLPSGFAILPDGPAVVSGGPILEVGSGGSLLTIAFQILVDTVPTAKLSLGSVATVNSLIKCTVERIRAAVM